MQCYEDSKWVATVFILRLCLIYQRTFSNHKCIRRRKRVTDSSTKENDAKEMKHEI